MVNAASVRVGAVVLGTLISLGWFLSRTRHSQFSKQNTSSYCAQLTDASGITPKTRIYIAGLEVGYVAAVSHVRNPQGKLLAHLDLRVVSTIPLTQSASLRKATESLLGDYRLEIDPGPPGDPLLPEGICLQHTDSTGDVESIKHELLAVARNLNKLSSNVNQALVSDKGDNTLAQIFATVLSAVKSIQETSDSLRKTVTTNQSEIKHIVQQVHVVTELLAQASQPNGDLRGSLHNIASLTAKLDKVAGTLAQIFDEQVGSSAANESAPKHPLLASLNNLNNATSELKSLTHKLNNGDGTLGRLINDPGIADRIETTLDSTNTILGNIARVEAQVEFRSEYAAPFKLKANSAADAGIKNTLALRLFPRPDKYYVLEAVSDPRGRQTRVVQTTRVGENGPLLLTDQTTTSFNALKFSAQFAKRYYFLTLRFGIIENTGGLGLNLHAFHDRAELRFDAFEFDRRNQRDESLMYPRLRATAFYRLANHIHMQGGVDDPLNAALRAWFMGLALRFTDDDLRSFLAISPRM